MKNRTFFNRKQFKDDRRDKIVERLSAKGNYIILLIILCYGKIMKR